MKLIRTVVNVIVFLWNHFFPKPYERKTTELEIKTARVRHRIEDMKRQLKNHNVDYESSEPDRDEDTSSVEDELNDIRAQLLNKTSRV